jgi:D-glycero-beta-D-manno-heptose-7-phosphate kinase
MRILVIGDEMIDRYWIGGISRLNPEKHSAPLLAVDRVIDCRGGAGNVCANVRAMGVESLLISQSSKAPVKNRLIDDGGVIARFDTDDECLPITADRILDQGVGYDAVIVSDYGKGAVNQEVAEAVRCLGVPTFVDAKVNPHHWSQWCAAMLPNEAEFNRHKVDYLDADICVIKQGARGARVRLRNSGFQFSINARKNRVVNVAGAGDTLVAAFVVSYMALQGQLASARLFDSMKVAMDFAGAAVISPLTAAPTFDSVYDSVTEGTPEYAVYMLLKR